MNKKRRENYQKNRDVICKQKMIYRHKKNKNIKYLFELGISKTKEYKQLMRIKRRILFKNAGSLTIETIQKVYEDNIKKYGTLTCYICLQSIIFGNDHLEHKIPLSRGGTNEKKNLAVACQHCNNRKYTKTEKEYRNWLMNK